MHVRYGSRRGQLIPNYVCNGRGWFYGDALCQSIVGSRIDAAISKLIVDSLTPTAIDLALAVQKEIERRADESDRLRHRQVERAQYEADQARQRYMLVDPSNRLVADSLEAEWNARLRALSDAKGNYESGRTSDRLIVREAQQRQIQELTTRFPDLWNDPNTPMRERKRMLALLVDDVTIVKQREVNLSVRFRGGATTTLTLPRPLLPSESRATHPEVRKLVEKLADEHTDPDRSRSQRARLVHGIRQVLRWPERALGTHRCSLQEPQGQAARTGLDDQHADGQRARCKAQRSTQDASGRPHRSPHL
jgi:hypothetical protein